MRLFTDRRFLIACLLGAMPFILVACFTEARGWAVTVLVVLGVLVAFGFSAGDGREPDLDDTEQFLNGVLARHGLTGAFRLDDLEHRIATGSAPDSVHVTFKANLTITEALYQTTVPPAGICGPLTPRRISSLSNLAERVMADSQSVPGATLPALPPDPYSHHYVEPRSQPGWSFAIAGTARAIHAARDGWHYHLLNAPKEFEQLAQTGRPRAAFVDAIPLDSDEGQRWLRETLAAWQKFEDDLNTARAALGEYRARRGHDAIAAFYETHRAGTCFEGTGETVTQKIAPLPFCLELTALDPAENRVHFTLRPARQSPHARRFSATLEHEPATGIVRLLAKTSASDVAPHGGPLLSAAAAFTMEFVWESQGVPQLTGHGADFVLNLREAGADALAGLRALGLDREREIWSAVTPGTNYTGSFGSEGRELQLRLVFMPGTQPGSLVAQLESETWSGICTVARAAGEVADGAHDLVLEPLDVPAPVGAGNDAGAEMWHRLRFRVEGRELSGVIDSATGPVPVTLRR